MKTHPRKFPSGYVAYYKTSMLKFAPMLNSFTMDKRTLELNDYNYTIENLDGYTFLCVEGCSEHEMAMDLLNS